MEEKHEFRYLVRIMQTDLDGNKAIAMAIRKIRGVNFMLSNAICRMANVEKTKKAGDLSDEDVLKLETVIRDPLKFKIPVWMLNRRKDYETGSDMHLFAADLDFAKGNDIKILKKIKSRRGIRHTAGLPLRGQRTKSNFRRTKSKGKGTLGVIKRSGAKPGKV
ncbi:MAG: 30S ribosomal protein S13 [Candidatus Woesearchaeota archaeon]|nr:30S ribosomal protein S13 [Candidatus Woesearchaeota archaeon]